MPRFPQQYYIIFKIGKLSNNLKIIALHVI